MRTIRVIRAALTALAVLAALAVRPAPAPAIVGGKPAPPGSFPYVADVLIGGAFGCTGSLIAPDWVLTAGHCGSITGSLSLGLVPTPAAWPASAYHVQLGSVYADGRGAERHAVSEVLVDSDYLITNGVGNDVTLLKLATPSHIEPMRIAPDDAGLWRAGVMATIAGFGTTSENSSTPPPQMRFAQVPITTDAYCAKAYPGGLDEIAGDGSFDPRTMICAGYPQGGTDTCEGDSGGPLLVPLASGEPILVGATSFGQGCAEAGHPGVYALLAAGPIRGFIARFVPSALAPAPAGQRGRRNARGHHPRGGRHRHHHARHRHRRHRGHHRHRAQRAGHRRQGH